MLEIERNALALTYKVDANPTAIIVTVCLEA